MHLWIWYTLNYTASLKKSIHVHVIHIITLHYKNMYNQRQTNKLDVYLYRLENHTALKLVSDSLKIWRHCVNREYEAECPSVRDFAVGSLSDWFWVGLLDGPSKQRHSDIYREIHNTRNIGAELLSLHKQRCMAHTQAYRPSQYQGQVLIDRLAHTWLCLLMFRLSIGSCIRSREIPIVDCIYNDNNVTYSAHGVT